MTMDSLQSRLALWLGLLLAVIFGSHIILMNHFPRYLAEERVLARLHHDADTLKEQLIIQQNAPPSLENKEALSFIYSTPLSGHYFQVQREDKALFSKSLSNHPLNIPPLTDYPSRLRIQGPQEQPLLVWVTQLQKDGQPFIVAVAEDISDIEEDIVSQQKIYLFASLVTLFLLIFFQWLFIRRAIEPVEKAKQELLAIEQGKRQKISTKVPSEIQPFVDEFNHLLEVMHKRLERSRNATGNLAHSLKTPLSVLNQLLDYPEIKKNTELHQELRNISLNIETSINRELKRARLSGGTLPGQSFNVKNEITELVDVMNKVYKHKNLDFDISLPHAKRYQADREDMLEMLGNLLDNASKWATSTVKLTVHDYLGFSFSLEDDGPGIDKDTQDSLITRGTKLDETTSGHGLGLSIVKEVIEQYKGEIQYSRSSALGGLKVKVTLPKK